VTDILTPKELGQIKRGFEIGHKGMVRYVWAPCIECGKQRWVRLKNNNIQKGPQDLRCFACSRSKYGKEAYAWKGGRCKDKDGYILICLSPEDFFASMRNSQGYVFEHRLVVARKLKRCLHPWELVHHRDKIKDHNFESNLQLITDDRHKQITILENKIGQQEREINLLKSQLRRNV